MEEDSLEFTRELPRGALSQHTLEVWDKVLAWIVRKQARGFHTKKHQIAFSLDHQFLTDFATRYSRFSCDKNILCCVTNDPKDFQIIRSHLKKIVDLSIPPEQKELIALEIVAKGIAYRTLRIGASFPLPFFYEGKLYTVTYTVDRVFSLWSDQKAYGLVDVLKKAPPILLFRGTDLTILSDSGRGSLLSDLDPDGPGFHVYTSGREDICAWLSRVTSRTKKARVIGHSLGGSLALHALFHDGRYFSTHKDESSLLYNYPGLTPTWHKKWLENPPKARCIGFVSEGDVISKFGKLVDTSYVMSFTQEPTPFKAHELLHFSQKHLVLKEINSEKENGCKYRKLFSGLQETISQVFYEMGLKYILPKE